MPSHTFSNMVQIAGGTFRMGSDVHYPEERPAHRVAVGDFCQRYRPAARYPQAIDTTTSHIGFRCVRRTTQETRTGDNE